MANIIELVTGLMEAVADAELMGAWASARNVLGPFKARNAPEAGGTQTPKAA